MHAKAQPERPSGRGPWMARVPFALNEAPRPREKRIFAFTTFYRADSKGGLRMRSPYDTALLQASREDCPCRVAEAFLSRLFAVRPRAPYQPEIAPCPARSPGESRDLG